MAVGFGVHGARSTARPLSDVAPTARINPSYCVAPLNQTGGDARYVARHGVRLLAAVDRAEEAEGDRRSEPESLVRAGARGSNTIVQLIGLARLACNRILDLAKLLASGEMG
jgi:hypothetical protein